MSGTDQSIHMRRATMEDSQTILDLWQGAASWMVETGITQWTPDMFTMEEVKEHITSGQELFLACMQDEVVGTVLIWWSDPDVWKELDDEESGYIHRLVVSRRHAGLGIGGQILQWAEDYITSKHKKPRLDCMEHNPRLNQFYQDNGYQLMGRFSWDDTWSGCLYEKKISK